MTSSIDCHRYVLEIDGSFARQIAKTNSEGLKRLLSAVKFCILVLSLGLRIEMETHANLVQFSSSQMYSYNTFAPKLFLERSVKAS